MVYKTNNMTIIYVLIVFFSFFSKQEPAYESFSSEIIVQHRKKILEPNGIYICALGGSSNNGIKKIDIGIAVKGPGSISEGRRHLSILVEDLLERYNNDVRIRPFLKDYPFTEENLSYTISYKDTEGLFFVITDQMVKDKQLALISMHNGIIYYDIKLSRELGTLKTIHNESYEEAKKILEEEDRQSQ